MTDTIAQGSDNTEFRHTPVLLNETLQGLKIRSDGVYVDCTFGRGGHSYAILDQLGENGRLLAFDRDPDAIAAVDEKLLGDPRFTLVHGSYTKLEETVKAMKLTKKVNGVFLDLGVSSPQLDDASRGFSFMRDGDLDMRMDNSHGMTAAEWLNLASAEEIANVLYEYGDERFSRRIARVIVEQRNKAPITRTTQLADLVASTIPSREKNKHPATRTFQAIRIFINRELEELDAVLTQAMNVLSVNGRLLVISFHSLEDRLVKRFMRDQSRGVDIPREIPVTHDVFKPKLTIIGKPVRSQPDDIKNNPRARSAVLRIAECPAP
ncbi:MAG: 16S rRNA (cytosine(1402)-N(4))-methyltransferase RsmH [Gammaproteobacteria bacterium]